MTERRTAAPPTTRDVRSNDARVPAKPRPLRDVVKGSTGGYVRDRAASVVVEETTERKVSVRETINIIKYHLNQCKYPLNTIKYHLNI